MHIELQLEEKHNIQYSRGNSEPSTSLLFTNQAEFTDVLLLLVLTMNIFTKFTLTS